ncbi:hypothetical protein [Limnobacter litoralis]|uniref:Uncharacterized protein n=1 Tax=Limnobacter litoralis TaxID=481366 RepID=A0ABQ5YPL4_9BURK|nr:hypothetical protein [Limnobacter litoralis]GLR26540.1 hypothetical protein GCM10007875_16300 [Limnobacter litoralis]
MAFELRDALVMIGEVVPRKVGPQDCRTLRATIKLSFEAPAIDILPEFSPSLRAFLFTDEGLRMPQLGEFHWDLEMANMELDVSGICFIGAKLGGFKIRPFLKSPEGEPLPEIDISQHQFVEIGFKADVEITDGRHVAILCELMGYETHLSLLARQQELDLQGA